MNGVEESFTGQEQNIKAYALTVLWDGVKINVLFECDAWGDVTITQVLDWGEILPVGTLSQGRWTFAGKEAMRVFSLLIKLAGPMVKQMIKKAEKNKPAKW